MLNALTSNSSGRLCRTTAGVVHTASKEHNCHLYTVSWFSQPALANGLHFADNGASQLGTNGPSSITTCDGGGERKKICVPRDWTFSSFPELSMARITAWYVPRCSSGMYAITIPELSMLAHARGIRVACDTKQSSTSAIPLPVSATPLHEAETK